MKRIIYADNAATTRLDADAFEAMKPFLICEYGNASQSYSFAREPKNALKKARRIIADCINASPDEIFFTSGGTESDNWAIIGTTLYAKRKTVVTSQIEHHAVLNPCNTLKKSGINIVYLSVNEVGLVGVESLGRALSPDVNLVSIMYANNEIGTIEPIKELCRCAHENGSLFHTDAVQAIGHVSIDVKELNVDLLSASAHKFNGPKGIGFLYIKKGTAIQQYMSGGSQEFGMRAGTENVASIVAMAIALKNNVDNLTKNTQHVIELEKHFIDRISKSGIDYKINRSENHIAGNISISINGFDGEALMHRLDLMGICVSTGAACDNVNTQVSHVLKAIGLSESLAKGTIRISLNKDNTLDDVDHIVYSLIKIING